jgi:hypothetical protein
MAISAFQKVLNRLFKQFALRNGREPQTPKEWMDIQNEAVQFFNRTKGVPPGPAAPPFQGWKPEVIQGGKGIESLLESGAVKKGVAPKTKLSTLEGKKTKQDEFINKEQWIAKKKAENKAAIERFKEKTKKKTVEDFRDEGDWDPGGFAGGGPVNLQQLIQMYMDEGLSHEEAVQAAEAAQSLPWDTLTKAEGGRIGLAGGGAIKKFIERLFIKASNDIRLGKGKWKGLTQDQWIKQHDDLTKMMKKWEWGGKKRLPSGAEEYIGMNDLQVARAVKQAEKQVGDEALMQKAYDEIKGGSGFTDDYKYDADILAEEYARQHGKVYADLPEDQISIYYDPALKRVSQDMLKRREARKALKDVEQKIELQMFDPKDRLPNQSGGLAYMLGEPTYMKAGGGHVGHGPWTTGQAAPQPQQQLETPPPQVQGQPNPMKIPQGIPSAAPRSMDPRVMQQQMMQRAMMGQQQRPRMEEGGTPEIPQEFLEDFKRKQYYDLLDKYRRFQEDYERRKDLAPTQEVADGGRIGLMYGGDPGFAFEYGGSWADWHDQHRNAMPIEDYIQTKLPKERLPFREPFAGGGMTRRMFLKLMSGLAALPFVGKGVQKAVPKVIPKVTETIVERGADGIPTYAFDLIEVVKAKGTKEIMEGIYKRNPPSVKYNYKGVDVVEDGMGNTSVQKQQTKTGSWTDEATDDVIADEYVDREVGFEIKQGEIVKGKDGKPIKAGDEYNESTAYMQGDPEGGIDVSEIVEKIDDVDHLELKEIADEIIDIRPKKASGGLAHMLGE